MKLVKLFTASLALSTAACDGPNVPTNNSENIETATSVPTETQEEIRAKLTYQEALECTASANVILEFSAKTIPANAKAAVSEMKNSAMADTFIKGVNLRESFITIDDGILKKTVSLMEGLYVQGDKAYSDFVKESLNKCGPAYIAPESMKKFTPG